MLRIRGLSGGGEDLSALARNVLLRVFRTSPDSQGRSDMSSIGWSSVLDSTLTGVKA